ncbi:MAG: hypothetical protein JJU00_16975 [Opitutales bacterium]|nr:hypothetical protein [Opitutales bacterium]
MPDLYSCEEGWYCFCTLPKKERIAAAHIEGEAALPAFAPVVRYLKNTRRGKVTFQEAMFPGYIFVQCDLKSVYRRIMATNGIRSLVTYGERVPQVPGDFIEAVREQIARAQQRADEPELAPGTTVVIAEGAFKGIEAVVSGAVPGKERVRLLLEFLGQQIEVKVPRKAVLRVKSPLQE